MNPTIDNDLQKAIDDITNSTNSDPVFGDAIASPEPIAPAPRPVTPAMSATPRAPRPMVGGPAPRPVAPRPATNSSMPRPSAPVAPMAPRPVAPAPRPVAPKPITPAPMPTSAPDPIAPAPVPPVPEMPSMPEPSPSDIPESSAFSEESIVSMESVSTPSAMREVKEAALRDLAPILSKVDMDSTKKFNLYKNIREELHDDSVIAPAYETAKDIADDRERADALLYLIDSIDNM